jgi:hypothetical protein
MGRASCSSWRRLVHRLYKVVQSLLVLKIFFTGDRDVDRLQTKSGRCEAVEGWTREAGGGWTREPEAGSSWTRWRPLPAVGGSAATAERRPHRLCTSTVCRPSSCPGSAALSPLHRHGRPAPTQRLCCAASVLHSSAPSRHQEEAARGRTEAKTLIRCTSFLFLPQVTSLVHVGGSSPDAAIHPFFLLHFRLGRLEWRPDSKVEDF